MKGPNSRFRRAYNRAARTAIVVSVAAIGVTGQAAVAQAHGPTTHPGHGVQPDNAPAGTATGHKVK